MTIQRSSNGSTPTQAAFSIGLNAVLKGSKKMTPEQQDALMTINTVRVLIVDASDETNVLLDTSVQAHEFKTGSVGYGVHVPSTAFHTNGS